MSAVTLAFINQSMSDLRRLTDQLTDLNRQMSTGAKHHDLKGYGGASSRLLSARTLLTQSDSRASTLEQMQARFGVQGSALGQVADAATLLSQSIREAISANDGRGIITELELSFASVVQALNETWNGQPMFAGERQGLGPIKIQTLEQLKTAITPAALFDEAARHQVIDLGTGSPIIVSAKASELSQPLFDTLRELKNLLDDHGGTIGQPISLEQQNALQQIAEGLTAHASQFTNEQARNGQIQKRFEVETIRLQERSDLIKKEIGEQADADGGEVAMRLSTLSLQYEAAAKTFAELSRLSLLDYL
ncbi:flagellin [Vitreimonas sp.]|jgi:flagellar hook-associated protein 3 FlgL|uniref:flagellin n=1 Tax=Vitreimonas sp. TaxID=3069702 RepID=UPI002ED8B50E